MSAAVHFLATVIWGAFGIVIGALAVVDSYVSDWVWLAIIVSVVGNSSHLVAFAWSQKGISVSASQASPQPPDVSGRNVVNNAGQVIGKIQ